MKTKRWNLGKKYFAELNYDYELICTYDKAV